MAAKKKSSPAFDLVVSMLKKNSKIAYADVRAAAAKKGFKIFPIVYGRAKALLGYVPTAPRGSRKAARTEKESGRAGGRSSVRDTDAMSSLEAVIGAMKDGERDRERYRRALQQIADIVQAAL